MTSSSVARLFIGSSAEGREVARNLQSELDGVCDISRWDQGVFEPSGYSLDSLLAVAHKVDFAVLVATPDDTTMSRGATSPSARDNIVLEFGLFAGVLGRERVYLLSAGDLKLPTDVLGLTRLPYHPQASGNVRAAVTSAALQVQDRITNLGPIDRGTATRDMGQRYAAVEQEIALLCANAAAQGWTIKTNSPTTLRLKSPRGRSFTLSKSQPEKTRSELRHFAAILRANGLRVNRSIRCPVEDAPF